MEKSSKVCRVHRSSVMRIQCRVLSVEFSKMDDAGWEGVPDTGSFVAVIVQFCLRVIVHCVFCVMFSKSDCDCSGEFGAFRGSARQ